MITPLDKKITWYLDGIEIIRVKDLKEAIKELKEVLCLRLPLYQDLIEIKISEIFGKLADNSPQKNTTSDLIGDSNFTRVSEDTKIKDDGVGK